MTSGEEQQTDADKRSAHYSALLGLWISTRMEKDKVLVSVSAGGIGLLVTLLVTAGPATAAGLALFLADIAAFGVVIVIELDVLNISAALVKRLLDDPNAASSDQLLQTVEGVAAWIFSAALILALAIGALVCVEQLSQ